MIKSRIRSDNGSSAGLIYIGLTMLVLLFAVIAVDTFKLIYIRTTLARMAQTATQTAVKQQDKIGGLKPDAARAVVEEYMTQRNGNNRDLYTNEIGSFTGPCNHDGQYPRFRITFDTGRRVGSHSAVYESSGGQVPAIPDAASFYEKQYTTVQVKIEDVIFNDFGSIFGRQCSVVGMYSSAIATGHFDSEN